jgi:hypothetical protein
MGLWRVLLTVQDDLQGSCDMIWIGFGMQGDVDFVRMLNGIRTGEHPAALEVIVQRCARELPEVDRIKPTVLYSK